ncbi:MAG: cupredoxin domain-containing protein [Actinomycetota bacterium]
MTVPVGTRLTVTNKDIATHTFTSVSGPAAFDSGDLAPGSAAKVTFTKAGTYSYHCDIHNSMTGSIVVK